MATFPTSSRIDAHYTPEWLAQEAVSRVRSNRPRIVGDIAAGEGSLLLEAERRWPRAHFIATDVDRTAVRQLALLHPDWSVGRCDFLNAKSRAACHALSAQKPFSLLLLNPPFTCRGGTRYTHTTTDGRVLHVGAAMAFLLTGLNYLAKNGEALAILPAGSLHSMKDSAAWEYLRRHYTVDVIGTWDKSAFPGCAATSALVHLHAKSSGKPSPLQRAKLTPGSRVIGTTLVRGTCPIHAAPPSADGPTLVHTTDLQESKVVLNGHRGFGQHRCIRGPAVVIPRVGQFSPKKIALFELTKNVMLSDCVIGMKAKSEAHARRLHQLLLKNSAHLQRCYVGTGAPFITLGRLQAALKAIGVSPTP